MKDGVKVSPAFKEKREPDFASSDVFEGGVTLVLDFAGYDA
jgi:hypothetical protein